MSVAPPPTPSSPPRRPAPLAQPPRPRRAGWLHRSVPATYVVILNVALCILFVPRVQAWLHIASPYPECSSAGINAGGEGTCADRGWPFGTTIESVVVDRAHTLRMPDYDAWLVRSTIKPTKVTGGSVDDYPGGRGWLASFFVAVTNTTDESLSFDADARDLWLILPVTAGSVHQIGRPQIRDAYDSRGPSVGEGGPLHPGETRTGWAEFVVPIWAPPMLRARPADLEFFPLGRRDDTFHGLIRLWK